MLFQLKGCRVRSLILLRQGRKSLLGGLPVAVALTKLREPDYKTSLLTTLLQHGSYASARPVTLLASLGYTFRNGANALEIWMTMDRSVKTA